MRLGRIALVLLAGLTLFGEDAAAVLPQETAREILVLEQSRNAHDGRLTALLEHEDPEVRARALRALGRIQNVETLPAMSAALQDADESVRVEAAFAVGQLFDRAAEDTLTKALAEETATPVRTQLAAGLGKCGTEASVAILATLVNSEEKPVAYEATLALGVLANRGPSIVDAGPALIQALLSKDPELRWRAAFSVQRGEVQSALTAIFNGLKATHDPRSLIFCVRALGAVGNRVNAKHLIPLLKHDDWRVRVETIRAFGALRAHFYTSQISLLLEDPNEHVRLAAIDAMGELASGGGLGRMEALESSSDWRVRAAIMKALAKGRGDGALHELKEGLKDPDPRIRLAAAQAFGSVPTEQSLVVLETMLNDESPQVQTALVNSLISFPQRHAVEVIRPMIESSDPAILTSAATAAGERFDLLATPLLLEAYEKLLSPVDVEPMVAILDALGSILTATEGDDPIGTLSKADRAKAAALLEAARHDSDPSVSMAAANALSLVTGKLVNPETPPTSDVPPQLNLDLALAMELGEKQPIARIVTNRGTITIRLNGKEAPGTVSHFVTLAREGFYNGISFHRVVADFVVQGGDPRGDGWGGPGYAIRCEYNPLRYSGGMVGMALSGKDTGGSQFFITHSAQPHLDGRYTIFGEVIEGMRVVNAIQVGDVINEIQLQGI